ncbi:unnamed protein product [Protopolystoma xenopodis]|uniref:Uncharacterized protein n=1 Tax=Protopolystoma xenopodis TaxID=117903 RepID=A0A3S5AE07_9PLAT|nr:unnamed protein product [Protopolystoma xenopodis]
MLEHTGLGHFSPAPPPRSGDLSTPVASPTDRALAATSVARLASSFPFLPIDTRVV